MAELPSLDFEYIRKEIDPLLVSTAMKIEREWPQGVSKEWEAQGVLLQLTGVIDNTYHAIRYICADKRSDPDRKLEYSIAAAPLTRVMLEVVFTTSLLFEDLSHNVLWFHKAFWRRIVEENAKFEDTYGHLPKWRDFFNGRRTLTDKLADALKLTAEERTAPERIKGWPTPGRMLQKWTGDSGKKAFLQHLYDWHYREMSEDAHVSAGGLGRMSIHLAPVDAETLEQALIRRKSDIVAAATSLALVFMSEVEIALRLGAAERLRVLWAIVNSVFEFSEEIYAARYRDAL